MMTIFRIFLKNAVRDVYLLFWSILLPLGMLIGLGLYFNTPEYHVRLLAGVIGTSALFWALETTVFYILKQRNRGVYKLLTQLSHIKNTFKILGFQHSFDLK